MGAWLRRFVVWTIVVLAAAGGVAYFWFAPASVSESVSAVEREIAVPVTRGTIERTIAATGQLMPLQDVSLRFSGGGLITEVLVSEGDHVKAGDVLVRIDDTSARLDYMRAQREYESARLDSPPSVVEERRLALQLAERAYKETTMTAPFDGIVAELNVAPGQRVSGQDVVVRLVDLSGYKVNVSVDEADLRYVARDQEVIVRVGTVQPATLTGRVVNIGLFPSSSDGVALYPVEVVLEAPQAVGTSATGRAFGMAGQMAGQVAGQIAGQMAGPLAGQGAMRFSQEGAERFVQRFEGAQGGFAQAGTGFPDGAFSPAQGVAQSGDGETGAGQPAGRSFGGFAGAAGFAGGAVPAAAQTEGGLRPGLTANVEIVVGQAANVLTVPVAAIVEAGPVSLVTRVNPDGSREEVAVETGLSDGLRVEIRSGLSEGDQVVMNNYQLYETLAAGASSGGQGGGGRGGFVGTTRIAIPGRGVVIGR